MKLTSQYSDSLDWMMYTSTDTWYTIPAKTGQIFPGQTLDLYYPTKSFQLALKTSGDFVKLVISAGKIYANDDEYVINPEGKVVPPDDAAVVSVGNVQTEIFGTLLEFFAAGATGYPVKITSTVQQVKNESGESGTKITDNTTTSTETKVSAEVSSPKAFPVGVSVNGSVSNKVEQKISKEVSSKTTANVSTQMSFSQEIGPLMMAANKITAVRLTWVRQYIDGSVQIGAQTLTYDATIRMSMSVTEQLQVDSPDQFSADILAEYKRQNAGWVSSGGSDSAGHNAGYSSVNVSNQFADGHPIALYLNDTSVGIPQPYGTIKSGENKLVILFNDADAYEVIAVDPAIAGCDAVHAVDNPKCRRSVTLVTCKASGPTFDLILK